MIDLKKYTPEIKESYLPQNEVLNKTAVSSNNYAIYYEFNGMKMWLSPSKKEPLGYTCFSHHFARFIFSENELCDKILQLTEDYPNNIWLYTNVE